jgi:hypothetical protein
VGGRSAASSMLTAEKGFAVLCCGIGHSGDISGSFGSSGTVVGWFKNDSGYGKGFTGETVRSDVFDATLV